MNEAYLSSDSYKRDPEQFYKAKEFHTHITKIKYPKYYNIIGKVEKASHEEVLKEAAAAGPKMVQLVYEMMPQL